MKKQLLPLFLYLTFMIPFSGQTQEPLEHQKRIYSSPEGKLYIQKSMPVYLRLATSPDEDAESYLLKSEESSKYSNPLYFDTEGWNTVRSPSAVDTSTREVVHPQQDVIFEVYADSRAPKSKIELPSADHRTKEGLVYFAEGVNFKLTGQDALSGLEDIYYSVNGKPYQLYEEPVVCKEEKAYHIRYYAVDHVRNVEQPHSVKFVIDKTPPVTTYSIEGDNKNNMLGTDAFIRLSSKDSLSGVKQIYYSINGEQAQVYDGPISVQQFEDNSNELIYYAEDHAGHREPEQSLKSSLEQEGDSGNEGESFSYYIDREAPEVSLAIIGDQYEGEHLYVSERSKVELKAKDDKSGVKEITYSVNNSGLSEPYEKPFALKEKGMQYVNFAAEDQVNNFSGRKTRKVFVDNERPEASVSFEDAHFKNRDTVFVLPSTRINLQSEDGESGIQKIQYQVDQQDEKTYRDPLQLSDSGFHIFNYRGVDRVNNKQKKQSVKVYVDDQAPEIYHHFSVKSIGTKEVREEQYTIYPSNCRLYVAATDMACGTDRIRYRINDGQWKTQIPLTDMKPGNYNVQIQAVDYLGNQTSESVKFAIEH